MPRHIHTHTSSHCARLKAKTKKKKIIKQTGYILKHSQAIHRQGLGI